MPKQPGTNEKNVGTYDGYKGPVKYCKKCGRTGAEGK